jgi:hypothetical protein
MAMVTSRSRTTFAVAAIAAIAIAGCGAGAPAPHVARAAPSLRAGWRGLRLPSGAVLPQPPGWRTIAGDPGTLSAALFDTDGLIRSYLNATPATRVETLADWTKFRLRHNTEELSHVRLLGAYTARLRGGREKACVIDRYSTAHTRYQELACLVTSGDWHSATVVVAAAQPIAWPNELPTLTYALDHFVA